MREIRTSGLMSGERRSGRARHRASPRTAACRDRQLWRYFVILSRGHAREALAWTRQVMGRLGLTLNEAKTSVREARRFDFLGYSFGPHWFQGWPLVPGGEPVQEERFPAQGEGPRGARPRQPRPLARGARSTEQHAARLVARLRPWDANAGLPGRRQRGLRGCSSFPGQAPQGVVARHQAFPR